MPVAINTFVILGGLMNKDNVVATLKQNAIVRRNFTDVCIKKVNDLNYGLVDYVYLQDNSKWFKTLLDMRFSAQEIVWLNYKMFGNTSVDKV